MLTQKSIMILMLLHFVADQLFQLKAVQVAKNKSTGMLAAHVFSWLIPIYAFGLYACYLTGNMYLALAWPITLGVIHFTAEWGFGRLYTSFQYKNYTRMMLLFFFLENLIIMMSMIVLFNYFFWLGL